MTSTHSRNTLHLAALALCTALNVTSFASLLNPSFEYPVVAQGQFTQDSIPGWGGGSGVWHIPTPTFFETTAPHGLQTGYSNANFVAQQSSNAVGLGLNTVTVQAGRRHDGYAGSFEMKVWAGGTQSNGNVTGGTLLTTVSFDHTTVPPDSFTLLTASYTAFPGDPTLGQFITVQLVRTTGSQINFDDVRVNSPGSETVAPATMTMNLGKVTEGGVSSLAESDQTSLVVCKFFVPNQASPFVQFVVSGNTTLATQTSLRFRTQVRMVHSGLFHQILRLFNFDTVTYEETRTDQINTGFQVIDLVASGDVGRYVGNGGLLQAMVQIRQAGPSTTLLPCTNFDLAVWDVAQ